MDFSSQGWWLCPCHLQGASTPVLTVQCGTEECSPLHALGLLGHPAWSWHPPRSHEGPPLTSSIHSCVPRLFGGGDSSQATTRDGHGWWLWCSPHIPLSLPTVLGGLS